MIIGLRSAKQNFILVERPSYCQMLNIGTKRFCMEKNDAADITI